MIGTFTAQADKTYSYLTFETIDGEKFSVESSSLSLSFSGNVLIVGPHTFTLSNLKKMYFSDTAELTTGIAVDSEIILHEAVCVYDLKGNEVDKEKVPNGIYIAKMKNGHYKIMIK